MVKKWKHLLSALKLVPPQVVEPVSLPALLIKENLHKLNMDQKKCNRSGRSGRLGWSGSVTHSQVETSPVSESITIITQPSQSYGNFQSWDSYQMITFMDAKVFLSLPCF